MTALMALAAVLVAVAVAVIWWMRRRPQPGPPPTELSPPEILDWDEVLLPETDERRRFGRHAQISVPAPDRAD